MPGVLSYGLVVAAGFLAGLFAAGAAAFEFSLGTATLILYAAGLAAFLAGADLLLSREGIRSLFEYGTDAAKHLVAFLGTAVLSLVIWLSWVLLSEGALRAVYTLAGFRAHPIARHGLLTLAPVAALAAVFGALAVLEFSAAGQPWWQRARGWLTQDWRGRLAPVLVACILVAAGFSVALGEYEFLMLVAITLAALGVLPAADRLFSRSRIWAVARQTVAEALHYKIVVVWVVAMLLLVVVMPRAVAGDGLTLKSKVQSYINIALVIVGGGLGLLTVGLSAYTLPNEITRKLIFMTTSKPIPRWQIFTGKWVGIGVLNAGLLLFSGAAIWGFTEYLRNQPTYDVDDRMALEAEVLSVRHGVPLQEPADLPARAEQIARQQREEGRIRADQEEEVRNRKTEELRQTWRSLPPGARQTYEFRNLMVERTKQDEFLHIRIKPNSTSGVDDIVFPIVYQAGDNDDPNTLTDVISSDVPAERFSTLVLPAWAVNNQGTLYFRMANLSTRDTMTFEGRETFELLYGIGTFHWNLVRAMTIIWCRLAFVAALGLVFSSFLSFPVAFMATVWVYVIAAMSGFISEALDSASSGIGGQDPIWGPLNLGVVLNPLAKAVVFLLPDFSQYDAVENVVDGRLVPLMWVFWSITKLVLFGCALLGVIGCTLLTSRELAREGA